jgi:hypothetical protein
MSVFSLSPHLLIPLLLHDQVFCLEIPDDHRHFIALFDIASRVAKNDKVIPVCFRLPGLTEGSNFRWVRYKKFSATGLIDGVGFDLPCKERRTFIRVDKISIPHFSIRLTGSSDFWVSISAFFEKLLERETPIMEQITKIDFKPFLRFVI